MKRLGLIFLIISLFPIIYAQTDTINQLDENGLRNGWWIGTYPDGTRRFEGRFDVGKPRGEIKRFYESGTIKAVLFYMDNDSIVNAQFFDEIGNTRASGIYSHQKKEGVWSFMNENKEAVFKVEFRHDFVDGISERYYSNGALMEKTTWKRNKLNGPQLLFDEQGNRKAEISYNEGIMSGPYKTWFTNGFIEVNGYYQDNLKTGKWQYFNVNGSLNFELIFEQGILQNSEVLNLQQQKIFEVYERNRILLKDPQQYLQDPETYFKK